MKHLENVEVFQADMRDWNVSNIWNEAEISFFQEVFMKIAPRNA